jgi:putative ABC transport system permease protein
MSWMHRLWNAVRPDRAERDIDRELTFHVEERADELRSAGLDPEEARRQARHRFGNVPLQAERTRDADLTLWLDALMRHLRLAVRSLRRTPGFSAAVVLTLALGIGANTAIFSALDAVLLRPLPFPDDDRLVHLPQVIDRLGGTLVAAARVADWEELNTTFDGISSYNTEGISDTTGDVPARVRRATVMPRFLEVFGITPILGRGFTDAEHTIGGPAAILISEGYWRRRFGSAPDVLERSVRMGERAYPIVGVLPASFRLAERDVEWWVPQWVDAPWGLNRTFNSDTAIGRLRPGVTIEQARTDLARVQARLGERYPETDDGLTPGVVPLKEVMVGDVRGSLWLLFGAVSLLLLIACTNIAALLLSRATRQGHEIAVRYALGASRAAVTGHVLAEAGVLAGAGAAVGLLVAVGGATLLRRLAPTLPRLDEAVIDVRVLLYTAVTAVAVALVCGALPAIRNARGAIAAHGARRTVTPRQSLQWWLVGVQMALSVTLLVGAGLLVRSLDTLSRVDLGFDPDRVLAFRVSASFGEEQDYNRTVERINRTLDALTALPDVEVSATAVQLPGVPGQVPRELTVVEAATETPLVADVRVVSYRYFETMQIPLEAGEPCRRTLTSVGVTEALVNRSFVDRYFPGRDLIGLHLAGGSDDRIMGLVGDTREQGAGSPPVPIVYQCFSAATPFPWFLVRTRVDPESAQAAVRRTLGELEPLRAVYDVAPLSQWIDDSRAQSRLRTNVLTLFAVAALSLAGLGVYATLAYAVSLRRREIGLRLAIGARRGAIVGQYLGTGLRVAALACAAGLLLSVALSRLLSGMLYGVTPYDPLTLSGVVGLVLVVGSAAALVPATRAALVRPMQVLREE